ncbi:MAG: PAS domain-containing sensor histidine kinase, partial [Acidobacteriota bacterium]|nr:PAS domain-containing sensor histidine kinase [Acidobacteriota bacterium]
MRHETRIALTAAVAGLPAVTVAIFALWVGDYATDVCITLTLLLLICWIGVATAVRNKVAYPLQAIANVLAALREGDFSLRARGTGGDDALNDVISEVNTLGATLQEQRLGVIETEALLRNVMREIEVAVFAFDERDNLRLVNHAGERLLAVPEEKLVGCDAEELGLEACLTGETVRQLTPSPVQSPAPLPTQSSVQLIDAAFPGGTGRWEVRRTTFRQSGRAHRLLVLSDLTKTLREEERQAWRRLIRVLGHELNNSLAPIKSLAGSMETLLDRQPRRSDWEDDMRRGLSVIQNRSESLSRFMEGYSRLAHLPSPTQRPVDVGEWIRRVVRLETRIAATVVPGPA